jgi:hypothetical protein
VCWGCWPCCAWACRRQHLDRALSQFEAFCTVTQSVSAGIPVEVQVFDAEGTRLK